MAFLIDTNILSELRKFPHSSPSVQAWQQSEMLSQDAYLSVLTIGEIRKGIEPAIDSLLAATARIHNLILATRNVKDLQDVDVKIVNPFEYGSDSYDAGASS